MSENTKGAVKHTPPPWKINHGGFRTDDGFSIATDNAAAERVKVVAECWPCSIVDQDHRDELLANARLIAAAPELLQACRALIASRHGYHEQVEAAYAAADAAIKKAEARDA